MKIGKPRIIDNTDFPERKVVSVRLINPMSIAGRDGVKVWLKLECGHTVGYKGDEKPETVKCMSCHKDGRQ